jgi:hypothetical protein
MTFDDDPMHMTAIATMSGSPVYGNIAACEISTRLYGNYTDFPSGNQCVVYLCGSR